MGESSSMSMNAPGVSAGFHALPSLGYTMHF